MSSLKAAANRANAKASTGPKTAQGSARATQNARRHGLNLSVMANPAHSADVEMLAHAIAGADSRAEVLQLARRVAEAQIDLSRIRQARYRRLARALADPNEFPERPTTGHKPAMTDRKRVMTAINPPAMVETGPRRDAASHKSSPAISAELLSALLVFDRYERRALSRRKFAIRDFDLTAQSFRRPF